MVGEPEDAAVRRTVRVSRSRAYPCPVEHAFDLVLPVPLPRILGHRSGPIPGIVALRDQRGDWRTAGQTRTIVLADRGTAEETLMVVDRPHSFDYRVHRVTGPMRLVVRALDGRWTFEPAGTGTRVTWSWEITPASRAARLLMPVVTRAWQGWAARAFDEIETLLVPAA